MVISKPYIKIAIPVLAIISFLVFAKFFIPDTLDASKLIHTKVAYVIDGDTIIIKGGKKVRLIGVDTPEKHESDKLYRIVQEKGVAPYLIQKQGEKASNFAKRLLQNKKIILKLDASNEYIKHKDKYGRILAYVYILNNPIKQKDLIRKIIIDKRLGKKYNVIYLNASLVNAGYAKVYRRFRYTEKAYFLSLEEDAKKYRRGLWKEEVIY